MYKKRLRFKSGTRKFAIAFLSGVMAVSLGLAAACTTTEDDDDNTTTSSTSDTQTILNGNFEFFDDSDDKTYIIYTPENWSESVSGRSNYVMNGILDTSASGWANFEDPAKLAQTLEDNEELDEDDPDYDELHKDYNGMREWDIPYADPQAALDDDATDEDKAVIANPETHDVITDAADGKTATFTDENGETVTLYKDDAGDYFYDEKFEEPYESHVLMVHNYATDDNDDGTHYGTAQSYSSASTITLDPNTAAEISVWVKTSDLKYDRSGATPEEELGAYIAVTQTVGGNTVDTFYIKGINTADLAESGNNNGWVQYTIFVQGCDFAETTFSVEVGLGLADDEGHFAETVEGYAFFDDITCTLYSDIEDSENYQFATDAANNLLDDNTTCDITDTDDFKIFSYDTFKGNTKFEAGYGRYFLIDLTAQLSEDGTRQTVDFGESTVSAGLTEDADHYFTSKSQTSPIGVSALEYGNSKYYNADLDIDTSKDVVGAFSLKNLDSELDANSSGAGVARYSELIKDALSGADTLPGADENNKAIMLLSSRGAAYTAKIEDSNLFTLNEDEYMIVSFWVRTSDMDGFTASTINIFDAADEETVSTLSADTTGVTFDVGDEKDIYGGWVQCFFYVENTTDEQQTFGIEFQFGNTAIHNTALSDYKAGWAAIANMQTFKVDEDVFNLASTGTYASAFSFTSTDNRSNNNFDDVYGALNNNIQSNISRPSSYDGVNGGSASVVYKDSADLDINGYDARNANENAGLVNQDYFGDYVEQLAAGNEGYVWLKKLLDSKGLDASSIVAATSAAEVWNEIFGSETIQPLLIVNTIRTFGENSAAMNYGYIADSDTTVASSSYQAITTRVKVSAGAVAYLYLTDSENGRRVNTFDLPGYSFWYDNAGNVLDGEPDENDPDYDTDEHIVYYLQDNGLYTDKAGNLYANMYNYGRAYYDEQAQYWAAGASEAVTLEEADNDTIYYISKEEAAKTDDKGVHNGIQVNHYLVAEDSDGTLTRVFRYEKGEYKYIVTHTDSDGNVTLEEVGPVENFVIGEGGVSLRYYNTNASKQLYSVVDARYDANGVLFGGRDPQTITMDWANDNLGYDANGNKIADTWQTVTFYVHTGDESMNYSLELWSGAREVSGLEADGTIAGDDAATAGSIDGSYVIFDYSNVTVDETTFANIIGKYESEIKDEYIALFRAHNLLDSGVIASADENLAYFESKFDEFVADGKLEDSDKPDYDALYYTYSLYDDEGYVPFNAETADDGETGYSYTASSYSETLVYLSVDDRATNSINVFVDYSATDVTVDIGTSDDTDDDEDEDTTDNTNVWLLVASIVLAVVLIFTLLSILIRDLLKRRKSTRKFTNRNVYSGKKKRYIRKLGLTETPAEDAEAPAEENNAETADEPAQTDVQSAEPAEESADVQPDAQNEEAPAEETETADSTENAEEGDKPEGEDK